MELVVAFIRDPLGGGGQLHIMLRGARGACVVGVIDYQCNGGAQVHLGRNEQRRDPATRRLHRPGIAHQGASTARCHGPLIHYSLHARSLFEGQVSLVVPNLDF
eukprot:COSAG01_NODE_8162_length_2895_cov_2.185265_3_plen_104_part_00